MYKVVEINDELDIIQEMGNTKTEYDANSYVTHLSDTNPERQFDYIKVDGI